MYVATKGGEAAIANAHGLLEQRRRPRDGSFALTVEQVVDQMWLAVSRVMSGGSVYDPELAALAIIQSQGDLVEAVFLCARIAQRCRGSPPCSPGGRRWRSG